jgi:hypothetical protein
LVGTWPSQTTGQFLPVAVLLEARAQDGLAHTYQDKTPASNSAFCTKHNQQKAPNSQQDS